MKIEQTGPAAVDQNSASEAPRQKSYWALNWLRFFLAIYIVLFHTLKNYDSIAHTWLQASLRLGNMATSVFFVLSGFLLTHAYVVSKNGRNVDTRRFLVARFSTLYPLHIVGLLLALVPMIHMLVTRGGISVAIDVEGTATRMLSEIELLLAFVMNILLLNAWNPYYLSFNGPSWSLSALACYYLIFPFVAIRIYRIKAPALALVWLGILFLLPGFVADILSRTDVFTDGLLHRNPIMRLPLFLAGMVLCVQFSRSRTAGSARQLAALSTVLLATIAVGIYLQFSENRLHMIRNGLYYPASLALIWLCICVKPTANEKLKYWGARLGAASLPIFFLHGPLFPWFRGFEKIMYGLIYSSDWKLSTLLAVGNTIERSTGLYFIYLTTLIGVCILVQERMVAPLQSSIRQRLALRRGQMPGDRQVDPLVSARNLPG